MTSKQVETLRRIRDAGRATAGVDPVTKATVYFAGERKLSTTVLMALLEKGLVDPVGLTVSPAGLAVIERADRQAEEAGLDW